jgi:23S rRNA (cytosine1962-C5)-methyltransferase
MIRSISDIKTQAVKLTPKAEVLIKKGHPWVFENSIRKIGEGAQTGDVCILFDHKNNKLYAVGLYDASSEIRIKIISKGPAKLTTDFFVKKLNGAIEKRVSLLSEDTNSYRVLYGENDLLPGVIVDYYDEIAVLKLYSSAWLPYLDFLKEALFQTLSPKAIVLRVSRNVEKENKQVLNATIIAGELTQEEIIFKEHNVRFSANVLKGHKTGFFLDHRHNRKRIGELAHNKTVLDVFAYAGGFSVHALVGGAKEVTSLDISEQALEMAKKNAALNAFKGKHTTIAGDAFEVLNKMIQKEIVFDLVVIDPPSFAKSKREAEQAIRKYTELAQLGVRLTKKGGILLLASCSSRVNLEEFERSHQIAFKQSGVQPEVIDITQHDVDHPIGFEEGAYLKSIYYRV